MPQIIHREPTGDWMRYVWSVEKDDDTTLYYWSLSYNGDLREQHQSADCEGEVPNLIPDSAFYSCPEDAQQALAEEIKKHAA